MWVHYGDILSIFDVRSHTYNGEMKLQEAVGISGSMSERGE